MAKFLDSTGLGHLWSKIKSLVSGVETNVNTELGKVKNYTINSKKISTNPSITKTDVGLSNVTNDAQVKRSEMGKASGVATLDADSKLPAEQLPTLKTINGTSVVGSGDIAIDLTLYKVVTTLPTADIDSNKIYLVKDASGSGQNVYTEYVYVDSKWETLGKYQSSVDLAPYVKFTDTATTNKAGAMSAADKAKLNGIAANATADLAMTTAEIDAICV